MRFFRHVFPTGGFSFLGKSRIGQAIEFIASVLTVFSIVVSALLFYAERSSRRRAVVFSAWDVVAGTEGKRADGGRSDALRQLREHNASLSGIDLSGAILRDVDLGGSDLSFASLNGVKFFHCILAQSDLTGASLEGGIFRDRCDFTGAVFRQVDLSGAILADTILAGAQFIGAQGNWRTSFNNAGMADAVIANASLRHVIFDNATLTRARILESDICEATFYRANLDHCRFVAVVAKGTLFQNSKGSDCVFSRASVFDDARFDGAILNAAVFESCSLVNTSFFGARLGKAHFRNCNLAGADFTSTILTDASILDCNVEGTKFSNSRYTANLFSSGCKGVPVDFRKDE